MLGDFNYFYKMMSVMALDGVTSFLCLKVITNARKCMRHSQSFLGRLKTTYVYTKLGVRINQ